MLGLRILKGARLAKQQQNQQQQLFLNPLRQNIENTEQVRTLTSQFGPNSNFFVHTKK